MTYHDESTARPLPHAGTMLPPFELAALDGRLLGPWQFKGRRNLVLYFVDDPACAACRQELQALADRYADMRGEDAELLVIVPGSVEEARQLANSLGLSCPMLVDPDLRIHRRYGAIALDGRPAPALFVADRYGEIFAESLGTFDHRLMAVDEVLAWLRLIGIQCPE